MGPGGNDSGKNKKYAMIGFSSLLLVAMVIGVAVTSTRGGGGGDGDAAANDGSKIVATNRAVTAICSPTDYKDACISSLSSVNSSDPRDLIKAAFNVAKKSIHDGIKEGTAELKKKAEGDPRTKEALDNCQELMEDAMDDLQKSFDKFGNFSLIDFEDFVEDLRVWLSGSLTYQQTCIDGFEGVDTEAADTLEKVFKTAKELTSNGLAMATNLANLLKGFQINIPGLTTGNSDDYENDPESDLDEAEANAQRRLLSVAAADEFPSWVSTSSRRLLAASGASVKADAVVAKDGSGRYKNINEALQAIPKMNSRRFVIYIKEGVYAEKVEITKKMQHVMFIGDGPTKTRITGKLCFFPSRVSTYRTATVAVGADWFMAKDIGFENSAGPQGHQAVALRVSADYAIFYNCHMDGYQDTLYVHTHRQFYRDCTISGTIDFVFGDAKAVFQNCQFVVRKPMENQQCIVTAQGRTDKRESTGIILHNCRILGDPAYLPVKTKNKAYMGRPWKQYSRTIIMHSVIDDIIDPEGWLKWNDTFALDTLFYAEYHNTGPGSDTSRRVKWKGIRQISDRAALRFTPGRFLRGNRWIPLAHVPYTANMN